MNACIWLGPLFAVLVSGIFIAAIKSYKVKFRILEKKLFCEPPSVLYRVQFKPWCAPWETSSCHNTEEEARKAMDLLIQRDRNPSLGEKVIFSTED